MTKYGLVMTPTLCGAAALGIISIRPSYFIPSATNVVLVVLLLGVGVVVIRFSITYLFIVFYSLRRFGHVNCH